MPKVRLGERRDAPVYSLKDLNMHFEVYRDANKDWRWRLRAANGETIAVSSESYRRKQSCLDSIELVKGSKGARVDVEDDG